MKIIGKDGKEYFDIKTCLKADKEYDEKIAAEKLAAEKEKKALEVKLEQEKNAISKRKKELSDAIELAEEKKVVAENLYDDAKKQADKILKEAKEKANGILQTAAKNLENASADKMKAIAAFNKEFGPYKTVVTGSKAVDDYNRIVNQINRIFDSFWNF